MPIVVSWMKQSACHRGATVALSLGIAHYEDNYDIVGVTAGFSADGDEVDMDQVVKLMEKVVPYVDRILRIADLNTYQGSAIAPEDANEPAPEFTDSFADRPFVAARTKQLSTYPVAKYDAKIVHETLGVIFPRLCDEDEEASSSSECSK